MCFWRWEVTLKHTLRSLEAGRQGLHVQIKAGLYLKATSAMPLTGYNEILTNRIINVQPAYFNHTDSLEHRMVLYDQTIWRTFYRYLSFPEANSSWFLSRRLPLLCVSIVKWVIQGRICNKPNWNLNRIEIQLIQKELSVKQELRG